MYYGTVGRNRNGVTPISSFADAQANDNLLVLW